MPLDKIDFRPNGARLCLYGFLTWTEMDGGKRRYIGLFTATLIHFSPRWHNGAAGRPPELCTCRWGKITPEPRRRRRRCPFTANWLLCAHHLVISSDWLMAELPLVIQVSRACVPVIKICHPEPHPSSPLNPCVRWQSSDNAPYSYFSKLHKSTSVSDKEEKPETFPLRLGEVGTLIKQTHFTQSRKMFSFFPLELFNVAGLQIHGQREISGIN